MTPLSLTRHSYDDSSPPPPAPRTPPSANPASIPRLTSESIAFRPAMTKRPSWSWRQSSPSHKASLSMSTSPYGSKTLSTDFKTPRAMVQATKNLTLLDDETADMGLPSLHRTPFYTPSPLRSEWDGVDLEDKSTTPKTSPKKGFFRQWFGRFRKTSIGGGGDRKESWDGIKTSRPTSGGGLAAVSEKRPGGAVAAQKSAPNDVKVSSKSIPRSSGGDMRPIQISPSATSAKTSKSSQTAAKVANKKMTLGEKTMAHHRFAKDFLEKYTPTDILGEGGFGFVAAALPRLLGTKQEVAVKFILKDKIPISAYIKDEQLKTAVPFEIYVMRRASHAGIVRYLDWYEDAKFYYLVTELHGSEWIMPEGPSKKPQGRRSSMDLFECIDVHDFFVEPLGKHIFKQVVETIEYLHCGLGIVHRDIKDENLVIDKNYCVKLIDFGAATFIPQPDTNGSIKLFSTFHGTLQYCSPEILKGHKYRGPEAEIWALGVLLYTMLFGENPFNDPKNIVTSAVTIRQLAATCGATVYIGDECITDPKLTKKTKQPLSSASTPTSPELMALSMQQMQVHQGKNIIRISSGCMDLLTRMLDRNPSTRITVSAILKHPWFH